MQMSYYQDCALATAVYPKELGLAYTALGLAGEAGEVANKIKKILRGDDENAEPSLADYQSGQFRISGDRREQIKKELGGVMWYLAATAKEAGLSLDEIADANIQELRSRQKRGVLKGDGDNR